MKQLRVNLLSLSESCTKRYNIIRTSTQELANFEAGERETLIGLNDEITALFTTLEKQAHEASGISKERKAVEKDLESILTTTKRQLVGISTKVSSGLEEVSSKIDNITKVNTGLDEVSVKSQQFQTTIIDTFTEALSKAQAAASKAEADAAKARADASR